MSVQVDLTFQVKGILPPQNGGMQPFGLTFADAEVPSGAINGVNTTFTLAHSPSPAASLILFWKKTFQIQGTDYTLSGNTITTTSFTPATNDTLVCFYRYLSLQLMELFATDFMTMTDGGGLNNIWRYLTDAFPGMSDSFAWAYQLSEVFAEQMVLSDAIGAGFGMTDSMALTDKVAIGLGLAISEAMTEYDAINFVG